MNTFNNILVCEFTGLVFQKSLGYRNIYQTLGEITKTAYYPKKSLRIVRASALNGEAHHVLQYYYWWH